MDTRIRPIETLPLSGTYRLSRPIVWVLRCISVILTILGTGMLPYAVSAQPQNFEILADSNTASPGDAVKVSFRSLDPEARQITSCQASFEGNLPEECDSVDGEWASVTLHVPENAEPGTMLISAGLTYYETQSESYRDATATIALRFHPRSVTVSRSRSLRYFCRTDSRKPGRCCDGIFPLIGAGQAADYFLPGPLREQSARNV